MNNLKLKKVIIPILLIAVLGGVGYITTTQIIKKENAKKIVLLNKQKADEKKANDKKVADAKALADAKAIEDAKAKAIEDAKSKSNDSRTGKDTVDGGKTSLH